MSMSEIFQSLFSQPVEPKPANPLDKLGAAIAAVAPHLSIASCAAWVEALAAPMRSSGITTARRIAAFLGQVSVESAGFAVLSENLNYSAERLCEVWPTHFKPVSACHYAGHPEMIADAVYCDRIGNGDEESGDGWRFRGAGLIQLTGRTNQTRFAVDARLKIGDIGDYLRTTKGAAQSSCWFWSLSDHKPSLNAKADLWDIAGITLAINGGHNGQAQRYALACDALKALQ